MLSFICLTMRIYNQFADHNSLQAKIYFTIQNSLLKMQCIFGKWSATGAKKGKKKMGVEQIYQGNKLICVIQIHTKQIKQKLTYENRSSTLNNHFCQLETQLNFSYWLSLSASFNFSVFWFPHSPVSWLYCGTSNKLSPDSPFLSVGYYQIIGSFLFYAPINKGRSPLAQSYSYESNIPTKIFLAIFQSPLQLSCTIIFQNCSPDILLFVGSQQVKFGLATTKQLFQTFSTNSSLFLYAFIFYILVGSSIILQQYAWPIEFQSLFNTSLKSWVSLFRYPPTIFLTTGSYLSISYTSSLGISEVGSTNILNIKSTQQQQKLIATQY